MQLHPRSLRARLAAALLTTAALAGCDPMAAPALPEPEPEPEPGPALPVEAPYAEQWSIDGPLDVDLIAGDPLAVPFVPRAEGPVVIGLIDSGVDVRHPELARTLWRNPGEVPGDCVDNDGNGYVDDVHGIRVDVERFDGALLPEPARADAFAAACADHHGELVAPGVCQASADADIGDARAIFGLVAAWERASTALDGNPLLHARVCPDGFGADRADRLALAAGDPTDFWYGHGTMMASVLAGRSLAEGEVASPAQLPDGQGGELGDHLRVVTCAAGFNDDILAGEGTQVLPMGTVDGFARCLDYFAGLIDAGVDLRVVNLSLGFAERFPMLGQPDLAMVDDVLLHRSAAVRDGFAALAARDVVFVAAAHNMFRDIDDVPAHAMYPAAFEIEGLIGVSGINRRGTLFGNRGRRTVDVVAPAQGLIHAAASPRIAMMARLVGPHARVLGADGTPPFDRVQRAEGSSQATAYVSAVVALMRAHAPTAALDAAAIRRRLIASATPLPAALPRMWVLREASDANLQALYWAMLGAVEPATREEKQAALAAASFGGAIARLDTALTCAGRVFRRLSGPVPRQAVAVGEAIVVEAEAFVCEAPADDEVIDVTVTGPDGTVSVLSLASQGGGRYAAELPIVAPGAYAFALAEAPDDVLRVEIE
ncbi:MAG: S8 family serine peptidase [Myxococcales bacterium]|nr:S8 family serine peptidase [Myxococcales bacterium]